jgi:sulfate transport system ATP-binding protein
VRPHELDIHRAHNGNSGLPARVVHVNPAGSVIRVELQAIDSGRAVHVELSQGRQAELRLAAGETVLVAPRKVRVFVPDDDYSI